jgi:hypothetical protein
MIEDRWSSTCFHARFLSFPTGSWQPWVPSVRQGSPFQGHHVEVWWSLEAPFFIPNDGFAEATLFNFCQSRPSCETETQRSNLCACTSRQSLYTHRSQRSRRGDKKTYPKANMAVIQQVPRNHISSNMFRSPKRNQHLHDGLFPWHHCEFLKFSQ